MVSQNQPGDTAPAKSSSVDIEEGLKLFQEASAKFLQADFSAQESAIKQRAQAYLDFQAEVRKVEQEAYGAVMELTKKHINSMGHQVAGSLEEMYYVRAQSQLDYEKEVRQVYIDIQAKLNTIAQKAFDGEGEGAIKQFANQRENAYQAYMADLQHAWSNTRALDPQTMNAIASNILLTINML